jgi:hypothetical protein
VPASEGDVRLEALHALESAVRHAFAEASREQEDFGAPPHVKDRIAQGFRIVRQNSE